MRLAIRFYYANEDLVKKSLDLISEETGVKVEFILWGEAKLVVSKDDLGPYYILALEKILKVQKSLETLTAFATCGVYVRLKKDDEFISERSFLILRDAQLTRVKRDMKKLRKKLAKLKGGSNARVRRRS